MTQTRRLAAILAADVAGYSQLMGVDEEGTLERLKALRRELVDPMIAEHKGRIVKTPGDGLLRIPRDISGETRVWLIPPRPPPAAGLRGKTRAAPDHANARRSAPRRA